MALNLTDICVGSTWALEYRRRLAAFTMAITQSDLHVIAPKINEDTPSFGALLARPFIPFDPYLWLGLLCTLAYAGYALYQLDAVEYEDEERDDTKIGGLSAKAKSQLKWSKDWRHVCCPTKADDAKELALSMANTVQAFLGSGDFRHSPNSPQACAYSATRSDRRAATPPLRRHQLAVVGRWRRGRGRLHRLVDADPRHGDQLHRAGDGDERGEQRARHDPLARGGHRAR